MDQLLVDLLQFQLPPEAGQLSNSVPFKVQGSRFAVQGPRFSLYALCPYLLRIRRRPYFFRSLPYLNQGIPGDKYRAYSLGQDLG